MTTLQGVGLHRGEVGALRRLLAQLRLVARRNWKSALLIAMLGISLLTAVLSVVSTVSGDSAYFQVGATTDMQSAFGDPGQTRGAFAITLPLSIGVFFVAAIG